MAGQGPEALRFFVDLTNQQKQAEKDRIIKAFMEGPIPVDGDTLESFVRLFVTDAIDVLRSHPGFPLEEKVRSLKTTLSLFERAADDLVAALYRFDAFSRTPEFHQLSHEVEQLDGDTLVRKEIYAFAGLAHALQDHCRRITKYVWKPSNLGAKMAEHFSVEGQHDFVCGLRTALHHLSMVEADWLIRNSGPNATSRYIFEVAELRPIQDWKSTARVFMDRARDQIDIRVLANDYRLRVRSFYAWFLGELEETLPVEVADYRRCWDEHRRRSARITYRFLIGEFLKRNIDPYPHLHKYLRSDQLAEVEALPKHSREQVDLIITMVDGLSACDDGLRISLYHLFGVPE